MPTAALLAQLELVDASDADRKRLDEEIAELKRDMKACLDDPKKLIKIRDLDQALRALGRTCTKKQLEVCVLFGFVARVSESDARDARVTFCRHPPRAIPRST